MDLNKDHEALSWSRFTSQFDQSQKLEALVRSLASPFNGVQQTIKQLFTDRWLDSAVGAQLDGAGDILGQPRRITDVVAYRFFGFRHQQNIGGFGQAPFRRPGQVLTQGSTVLDDINYRKLLKWKSIVNQCHGTSEEIEKALKVLFGASAVSVLDSGNASIHIVINKVANDEDIFLKNTLKWIPRAAGIKVTYDQADFDKWLTMDSTEHTMDSDQLTWDMIGY